MANWLKEETPHDTFLANLGSGANIRNRTYQVIAHFVPIQFNPSLEVVAECMLTCVTLVDTHFLFAGVVR